MKQRILVAGIGNIFLGDDAFGVEVVRRLADRPLPDEVRVVDYGIRGLDLVYALLDGWDAVILIDAVPRGEPPGTLYLIEPEWDEIRGGEANLAIDGHQMDPLRVLRLASGMGAQLAQTVIVGCEPSPLDGYDIQAGLSPAVQAALPRAVEMVAATVKRMFEEAAVMRVVIK
ncbi:MAG TPA: hydrogenase maturation protease [Pirellulales bacterium]|nr:hydrogenase maturation protease [Pirellulales bacterium]